MNLAELVRGTLLTAFAVVLVMGSSAYLLAQNAQQRRDVFWIRVPPAAGRPASGQTGFRLAGTRGIVTALHGVVGACPCSALNDLNQVVTGLIITHADIDNDVAVLASDDETFSSLEGLPRSNAVVAPGALLYELGHPQGINLHLKTVQAARTPTVSLSRLIPPARASAFSSRSSPSPTIQVLDIEASLVPGDSGAPIVDDIGAVVGIVSGGLLGGAAAISWAIPINNIRLRNVSTLTSSIARLSSLSVTDLFALDIDRPATIPTATRVWEARQDSRRAVVQGRLIDKSGKPIPKVTIFVTRFMGREKRKLPEAESDADGRYSISLNPGGYDLYFRKDNLEWVHWAYVPLIPGVTITSDFVLEPVSSRVIGDSVVPFMKVTTSVGYSDIDSKEAQIVGQISDFSGQPVAGAFITAADSNMPDSMNDSDVEVSWRARTVRASSEGRFTMSLAPGLYDLTVEAPEFRTSKIFNVPTAPGVALVVSERLSVLRPR